MYRSAQLYLEEKKTAEAEQNAQKLLDSHPDFEPYLVLELMGDINFKKEDKKFNEALDWYQKAEKVEPENAEIFIKQGKCLEKMKELDQAIERFSKAVELAPDNPVAHFRLGWAQFRKGVKEECIQHLQKALELKPDFVEVLIRLGDVLLRDEAKIAEAEQYVQKALELDPNSSEALVSLGRIREKQ